MSQAISRQEGRNPLGYEKIPVLLRRYAIPSIIAMVVSSLYNIVDQIFIGQGVGYLGNAATNVAYPLTTICLSIALLIGIGGASRFSLSLGAGDEEAAERAAGTAVTMLAVGGVLYAVKWPGRNNPRFGCHEIFHVFILLGSLCHFFLMYQVIAHL